MAKKPVNPAKEVRARKRLRVVEELYLNGYGAQEIHDLIGNQYDVTYGTVRNDIVKVRKAHRDAIDESTQLSAMETYRASLLQIRRKSLSGWEEIGADGVTRIRGRDFRVALKCDEELALLGGVNLRDKTRRVEVDVEAVQAHTGGVMEIVFACIEDEDIDRGDLKDAIVAALDEAAGDE